MTDPRLLTLLTLVQVKNYTKTAQRLFITQPAVSHHIKSLENEYDIEIFTGKKQFELSKQGQILVEYAIRMVNQSRELTEAISDSLLKKKKLKLGISYEAIALCGKNRLLDYLFEIYNDEAEVLTLPEIEIFAALKQGKMDFAIVDTSYDDETFDGISLEQQQIVPVCATEGKFKEIKRVTRDMLKNNALILGTKGGGMAEATLMSLKQSNINISNVQIFHSNSFYLLGEIIKSKDGIGFMYQDLLEPLHGLKKMDLINFKCSSNIYLIFSQNSFDKQTLKSLVKGLKKWKAQP